MSDECFYGITLSATHQSETWDSVTKPVYPHNNKLVIRQALLGPDAKPDELNVVQVEAMSYQDLVKIPVAILKVGETRDVRLDIEFPDAPVTFTLIKGSGPVHLLGQQLYGARRYDDVEEELEEEMLDDEDNDTDQKEEKERKSVASKRKINEDEDGENGESNGKKAKLSNNSKDKAAPSPKKKGDK